MFEDYIQTTNWLDRDCLLKEDHFILHAARPLMIQKQRKIYYQPIDYMVDKITPQETFDFIQLSKTNMTPYEKEHVYTSPEEITRPYYKISRNGQTLFVTSASIEQQDTIVRSEFMQTTTGSNNIMIVDLFSDPNLINVLTNIKQTAFNAYKVLESFLGKIQHETLKRHAPTSVIDVRIQALVTDELASATVCQIHKTLYNASNIALNGDTNDFSKGGIIAVRLCITQFNIDKAIGKKKVTAKERKEFLKKTKAQQEIDEQIKNSPTAQQKYQQKLQYNKKHKNKRQTA